MNGCLRRRLAALFGVVMVYSASAMLAAQENNNQFHYVARQAVWTVIGLVAMLAAMHIDYRWLNDWRIANGLLAVCALMLVAVFGFGAVNGAQRWIRFGSFSLQPSEFTKLALAIFLARFLERRAGEEDSFWRTFAPCVCVTGFLVLLVVPSRTWARR